jgi:heme/copper-type cytochrome/quinol oxidase subunit 2
LSMSKAPTMFDSIRMILVLALVFLLSLLGTNIIGAPVITALVYFVMQYRRRIKALENRLSDAGTATSAAHGSTPPEPPAPPMSTDA